MEDIIRNEYPNQINIPIILGIISIMFKYGFVLLPLITKHPHMITETLPSSSMITEIILGVWSECRAFSEQIYDRIFRSSRKKFVFALKFVDTK
jgi:hypothetical protein